MTIVAAVDGTRNDQSIISEGSALAEAFDDELHVVHVLDRDGIENASGDNQQPIGDRAETVAADAASPVTDEFMPIGRIGSPAPEIEKYVDVVNARYLVIGGRKRSPIGKALFGSVTQSLLLSVDKPIVTVRSQKDS